MPVMNKSFITKGLVTLALCGAAVVAARWTARQVQASNQRAAHFEVVGDPWQIHDVTDRAKAVQTVFE
jgi:hypothetical protein